MSAPRRTPRPLSILGALAAAVAGLVSLVAGRVRAEVAVLLCVPSTKVLVVSG